MPHNQHQASRKAHAHVTRISWNPYWSTDLLLVVAATFLHLSPLLLSCQHTCATSTLCSR
eukprot:m.233145 g.233145  ORF g.233145 m.233145 type:complete len:60 (-) comp18895_c0_seq2:125-304(-)